MNKKKTAIIAAALVLLVLGAVLYYLFFRGGASLPPPSGGGTFPSETGGAGIGQGGGAGGNLSGGGTGAATTTGATGPFVPVLKQLTASPEGGATIVATTTGIAIRYVDRGLGNIYQVNPDGTARIRLSNKTVPKIYESLWPPGGASVILRFPREGSESIASFYGTLVPPSGSSTDGSLDGSFLTENIRAMTLSPDGKNVFYTLTRSDGTTGIIANPDGSRRIQALDTPLRELNIAWPAANLITLTTKPSANVNGMLFFLNSRNGVLTRVFTGVPGLTDLVSPDAGMILYSQSGGSGFALRLYSAKDGGIRTATVATFPEKCVWSRLATDTIFCAVPTVIPPGSYPDDWYQGRVSFSDELWTINAATGVSQFLFPLRQYAGEDIDATNLMLSPDERYLVFTNKSDLTLWALQMKP